MVFVPTILFVGIDPAAEFFIVESILSMHIWTWFLVLSVSLGLISLIWGALQERRGEAKKTKKIIKVTKKNLRKHLQETGKSLSDYLEQAMAT
jgi:hypothetical protein